LHVGSNGDWCNIYIGLLLKAWWQFFNRRVHFRKSLEKDKKPNAAKNVFPELQQNNLSQKRNKYVALNLIKRDNV
jgi:hypothetical protein